MRIGSTVCWQLFLRSRGEEKQGGRDVLACTEVYMVAEEKCQVSLLSTVPFPPSTMDVPVTAREQPGQQKCWPLLGPQRSPAARGNAKVEEAQRHDKALLLQELAAPAATQGMLHSGWQAEHGCLMPSLSSLASASWGSPWT